MSSVIYYTGINFSGQARVVNESQPENSREVEMINDTVVAYDNRAYKRREVTLEVTNGTDFDKLLNSRSLASISSVLNDDMTIIKNNVGNNIVQVRYKVLVVQPRHQPTLLDINNNATAYCNYTLLCKAIPAKIS